MVIGPNFEMTQDRFGPDTGRAAGYEQVTLVAGRREIERIVPPAGEDWAFTVQKWARRITVSVSPMGRSVRVWVDGTEIK